MPEQHSDTDHDNHASMANRGVTRTPMESGADNGMMSADDRRKMQAKHHSQTEWVWWTLVLLGVWTMAAPFSFGYAINPVSPAAADASPLPMSWRINGMIWSDLISGLLLVVSDGEH